jgi:multiple sugar transport system ATP-binding protein
MNIFQGSLRQTPAGARLDLGSDVLVALPALPQASDGVELSVGIRPEHVRLGDAAAPEAPVCPVELVEPTGIGAIVHLRFADTALKAFHLGRTDLKPGDDVAVDLPSERLHLFETSSGRRIEQ